MIYASIVSRTFSSSLLTREQGILPRKQYIVVQALLLYYVANNATNSSFYAHCFDVSRWSRATFSYDFALTITYITPVFNVALPLLLRCRLVGDVTLQNLPHSRFGHNMKNLWH